MGTVLQIRFEDRLQRELGGSQDHPIPNCRDGGFIMHLSQLRLRICGFLNSA